MTRSPAGQLATFIGNQNEERRDVTVSCDLSSDQPRGHVPCVPSTTRYQSALQLSSAHTSILSSPTGTPRPRTQPCLPRSSLPPALGHVCTRARASAPAHAHPSKVLLAALRSQERGSQPKLLTAPRAAALGGPCPHTALLFPRETPLALPHGGPVPAHPVSGTA